jgi:hypothetical protein
MKWLVDVAFPNAIKVRVVQDNLNTHVKASLYKKFPASEARRILNRLEFHYTPKHGSWLNMAEIELSVLSRQCLDCRIPDKETLQPFSHQSATSCRVGIAHKVLLLWVLRSGGRCPPYW